MSNLLRPKSCASLAALLCAAACLFGGVDVSRARAADGEPAAPDFNAAIAPLLKKYCSACHNASDAEHGLVLDTYEALLAGGNGGAVIVPGKSDNSRLALMLDGRAKPVMPPEGNEALTADEVALIKRWIDAGAKSPTGAPPDPTLLVTPKVPLHGKPRRQINALAVSPDGKLIAAATYKDILLIDAVSRATVRKLSGQRGNVTDVEFSKDGMRLISAAGEAGLFGEVMLWNVADGAPLRTIVGHRDSLYAATVSPDGKLLATGSYDQQIKLWDATTGAEIRTILGHNGAVFDLAFSPDGRFLASASADRSVKLWDVATGERLDTFGQPLKEVYTVAFTPDGRHVAAGSVDNRIRIWRLSDTGKEGTNPLIHTRFAHEGAVIKLAFSPDGRWLASAAEDRTVKLWDGADFVEQRVLETQPDWPAALAILPDNKSLLAGRLDGSLAYYDLTTGAPMPPAKPELTSIEPRGVQRGVTTKVRITGKNLLDVTEAKFDRGDFASRILPADEPRAEEIWLEVTAQAKVTRGSYRVALITAGGTSNEVRLDVDDLPQLAEAEPNAAPATLAPIALPASLWGVVPTAGDIDHASFEAAAGQTLVFDLAAKRLGSKLNAVLTLLGPTGEILATSNDFHGDVDPFLAFQVPAAGRYSVRVRDLALAGSPEHFYRLTMGELPFVTSAFPLSVARGSKNAISLVGYNLPPDAQVSIATDKAGEASVPLDEAQYRSRGGLKVLVSDSTEIVENEPNDEPAAATQLTVPAVANGRIVRPDHNASDADLYRFTAKKGESWIIEIEAARRKSPLDSKIEILDSRGEPIERLLLQAVRDSYIEFRPIDSNQPGFRAKNWEEMELNEYVYLQGEVCKVFRMPQGPDSEMQMYTLGGKRRGYFDTSATAHPLDESVYTVVPQQPGATLVSTGLPVFPLYYANDDDGDRRLGRDSRLTFTAPADGDYLVRVTDVGGVGSPMHAYRLIVRQPRPDFQVRLGNRDLTVPAGSGQRVTITADRIDGFDGDISVEAAGLPAGFSMTSPTVIQAGHSEARAVVNATADAEKPTAEALAQIKITAKGMIDGAWVERPVQPLQLHVGEKPKLIVHLEPAELTIAPGTTITALLKVERQGFDDLMNFEVDNLPHGIIVDNIGLSGVLIRAGESERQIFLTAAKWVPETSRQIHAVANVAGSQASRPITLHVRRPTVVADAAAPANK